MSCFRYVVGSYIVFSFVMRPALAVTLQEAYLQAKSYRSEILNASLDIKQAELEEKLIKSEYLPNLSLNTKVGAEGDFEDKNFENQHRTALSLTQPIYRGDWSSNFRLADSLIYEAKERLGLSSANLYSTVATAFFTALTQESELFYLDSQNLALKKRIQIIDSRIKIGRSKATDLIAAQAQLARVTAQISEAKGNLDSSKLGLANLMGTSIRPKKLDYRSQVTAIPKHWFAKILNQPAIKVKEKELEQSKIREDLERGDYYPQIDAALNYYPYQTEATGYPDWDISLNATWVLYDGGSRKSSIAIQNIKSLKINNDLSNLKLLANNQYLEITDKIKSIDAEVKNLKQAVMLAKKNYDLHQKEYDSGLVSILDVLRALDDYLILQRSLSAREYASALLFHQLKAYVGDLP